MPEGEFPIKERMLYSTCKGPLLEYSEKQIGLTIAKKVTCINNCMVLFSVLLIVGLGLIELYLETNETDTFYYQQKMMYYSEYNVHIILLQFNQFIHGPASKIRCHIFCALKSVYCTTTLMYNIPLKQS